MRKIILEKGLRRRVRFGRTGAQHASFGTPQSHVRHYGHQLHFWLKVKKGVAEKYFFPTELGP